MSEVMVIDDDLLILCIVKQVLTKKIGFKVETALNGKERIQKFDG